MEINTRTLKDNTVTNGDLVAGDKQIIIKKEIAEASQPIRPIFDFNPDIDENHTVLLRKLEIGKFNSELKRNAKRAKIKALKILFSISTTEEGKRVIADIYDNLLSAINCKHTSCLEDGELLKTRLAQIYEEFTLLAKKYKQIISIDEAFLEGLLFIATSNCALRWKIEEHE